MRIVGGRLRGRSLAGPRSNDIRPTSDRLRETLFNILAHGYGLPEPETRVLDLFAGTGALGLEALSRGAAQAHFVETGVGARGLIRQNVEALGLTGHTKILRRDATDLGSAGTIAPFGLVFCDPPYGKGFGERALAGARKGGWLEPGAVCILEERAAAEIAPPEGFEPLDRRAMGDSQILVLRNV
ncbi:16S rRNA (guanine(966)-N(2))-methyltransferase RsmD [Faunimonas sp. B44]|uniref:16S rRNA (guanine(966)-N(2))-methyltransferase RsmD n=1 Tax=Faunimonas sp. B44 TaxID=3461493 RepID=UPI0040444FE7